MSTLFIVLSVGFPSKLVHIELEVLIWAMLS